MRLFAVLALLSCVHVCRADCGTAIANYCLETVSETLPGLTTSISQNFGLVVDTSSGTICSVIAAVSAFDYLGVSFPLVALLPTGALQPSNETANSFLWSGPGPEQTLAINVALQVAAPPGYTVSAARGVPTIQIHGSGSLAAPSRFHFATDAVVAGPGTAGWGTMPSALVVASLVVANADGADCVVGSGAGPQGVTGDPVFVGLRGQRYQVHGLPNHVYNLVTSRDLQINARFVLLEEGVCPANGDTADCWSHVGSYISEVGIQQRMAHNCTRRVRVLAGDAASGFALTDVHDECPAYSADGMSEDLFFFRLHDKYRITVLTNLFSLVLRNSDGFLNEEFQARVPLSWIQAHGLFGQTSRKRVYNNALRHVEGAVDDYAVLEHNVFGVDFLYNLFDEGRAARG